MNTRDTTMLRALRDLDPARTPDLTAEDRVRADATFARIVASPPGSAPPTRPRRRRGPALVGAAVTGAVGATVAALLVGNASAFATWTPVPEPLSGSAATMAAASCLERLDQPERGEQVVLAERRGGWTYVLLAGPRSAGSCLMPGDGGAPPTDGDGFFGGYSEGPPEPALPARDGIDETDVMTGNVGAAGPWPWSSPDDWFTWTQGFVGADVTAITVHPPVGPDVEATVGNGRFAAWWPSGRPSSSNLEAMGPWTYTLTLADGTTRSVTG